MRIAAAQTAPVWGNADATSQVVVDWIHKAYAYYLTAATFSESSRKVDR